MFILLLSLLSHKHIEVFTTTFASLTYIPTGDGFITFNEIEFAMDGEDDETKVQTYLRSVQCPVLNALASRDPKKTRRAFDKMDVASRCVLLSLQILANTGERPNLSKVK